LILIVYQLPNNMVCTMKLVNNEPWINDNPVCMKLQNLKSLQFHLLNALSCLIWTTTRGLSELVFLTWLFRDCLGSCKFMVPNMKRFSFKFLHRLVKQCLVVAVNLDFQSTQKKANFVRDHPMTIHVQFWFNQVFRFWENYVFIFL